MATVHSLQRDLPAPLSLESSPMPGYFLFSLLDSSNSEKTLVLAAWNQYARIQERKGLRKGKWFDRMLRSVHPEVYMCSTQHTQLGQSQSATQSLRWVSRGSRVGSCALASHGRRRIGGYVLWSRVLIQPSSPNTLHSHLNRFLLDFCSPEGFVIEMGFNFSMQSHVYSLSSSSLLSWALSVLKNSDPFKWMRCLEE